MKTIEDCLAAGFDIFIVKPLTEFIAKRALKNISQNQIKMISTHSLNHQEGHHHANFNEKNGRKHYHWY